MMTASVVFVVVSSQQWQAAAGVALHLDRGALVFDPHVDRWEALVPDQAYGRPRLVGSGYREVVRAVRRLRARLKTADPGVMVFPQDAGLVERACIAEARRSGWQIVLMPDGLVVSKVRTAGRWQRAKDMADAILSRLGLLAGDRGRMGSSRPDLVLSWGKGWAEAWSAMAPDSNVIVVGSPRSSELETVAPRPGDGHLLFCSQPFSRIDRDLDRMERRWFAWIEDLARRDHGLKVRLRLHPAELANGVDEQLAPELRARLSVGSLAEDLTWSDLVVSPLSTVLLEGAGCGRPVASVDVGLGHLLDGSPFFDDPRLLQLSLDPPPGLDRLGAIVGQVGDAQEGLGSDFLANPGQAGALAARAVEGLLRG